LVSKSGNQTSLLAMKEFVNNTGLYCTAVDADIKTLKNLKNCQVILHLPDKNHFVVLDELNKDATPADLSKCAALLISDKPFEKQFAAIPDARLDGITGAAYTCTKVLQYGSETTCTPPVCSDEGCSCDGSYTVSYTVLGCQLASSGTCSSGYQTRYRTCPCAYNGYIDDCQGNGEWTYYYMRACESY